MHDVYQSNEKELLRNSIKIHRFLSIERLEKHGNNFKRNIMRSLINQHCDDF